MTRREAYCWLSHVMGIPEPQAHMSKMKSVRRLRLVIELCDGLVGRTEVEEDFSSPPPKIGDNNA